MLNFANPFGLLALLGIPAVLAIHFLQRKAVELPISTLFLLERTQRDAASGRRLERIIPSIPLWMQLLAVLLLAWFLAEPRFEKSGSVQRIAIVLNSSASMGVFKNEAITRLVAELPNLQGSASTAEFTVMESEPSRQRIYAGTKIAELTIALEKWQPLAGLTDPTQTLRLARSLVSSEGTVIYLTDTPTDTLPFEARIISVGEAIENVGFTGFSFVNEGGVLVWKALVRNYSNQPLERTWSIQTLSGNSEPRSLQLAANALMTLQAAFPCDSKNVRIVLSADRFTMDDTLPLVAPKPKSLALFATKSPAYADLTKKLMRALDSTTSTNDAAAADLTISANDPLNSAPSSGNAIVFVEASTPNGAYLKGNIVAEPHPLLDQMNWQSLLIRETTQLDRLPGDTVLLWQDKRPLIFLRTKPASETQAATQQLHFNFDLKLSNAESQPAFIVLLHRFAESIREAKIAATSMNLETNQPIKITAAPNIPLESIATDFTGKPLNASISLTQAPSTPCFLTIEQAGAPLVDAAVFFADTREADFSRCGKSDAFSAPTQTSIERHTKPDPFWRGWILLLIAALLASWRFNASKLAIA